MADRIELEGRVAVVTGAGTGLGRAHALLLGQRGAKVVVNDIGGSVHGEGADSGPAAGVVEEIRAAGGEAVADGHDISTPEGGAAVIQTAVDGFGGVDVLVNNAGILRNAMFEDQDEQHLEPVLDVHLRGAFFVTRPAWDVMRRRGGGSIVNTTSGAGLLGSPGMTNYGSAKGGVYGLTRVLAVEGVQHGIRVNAIAPFAATRMLSESMAEVPDGADEAAMEMMRGIVQALDPALVSPLVAWLASPQCPTTGEVFTVGGGHVSRFFLGRTPGWTGRGGLTVEDVRDHWDEIRAEDGYTVPTFTGDESTVLFEAIAKANAV